MSITENKASKLLSFSINEIVETRSLTEADIYMPGITGRIHSKDASSVLLKLADLLPLQHFGLGHLKRARKLKAEDGTKLDITEVFLCPASYFDNVPAELTSLLLSTTIYQVSRVQPETAEEFLNWGKEWPLQFRPNETVRKVMRGLPKEDAPMHSRFMTLAREDGSRFTDSNNERNILKESISRLPHLQCPGAIIVNPQTQKVVMSSFDAYMHLVSKHGSDQAMSLLLCPLSTPTMLAIEGVAACVRGDIDDAEETPENYVCCGLDLYVVREPDIMDSMALVHSRIRHVYYETPDASDGGLGSCFNIHYVRSLNHHYRVFHCVPELS